MVRVTDINTNQEISVSADESFNLIVQDELNVTLNVLESMRGLLFLNLFGQGTLNLTINFEAEVNVDCLLINQSDHNLNINEKVTIAEQSNVVINYGELSNGNHNKESFYFLQGKDSNLNIRSANIASNVLDWKINVVHQAKNTYAMVKSYGVVFEGGKLSLDVLGKIEKYQSRSKTHQISRIMNMSDSVKARVYPQLIIDENDVQASHAATVGQPDVEAIYYMQSRGLSRKETLRLITLGYLLPIIDVIEDEKIKSQLVEMISKKVEMI